MPCVIVTTALSNSNFLSSDSWIEVSSRPSSSFSSNAELHQQQTAERHSRQANVRPSNPPRSISATGSSQDEYEESSSESDRVLSSSNEDISREDDDDRTALGARQAESVFTPPANVFTHPPTSEGTPPTCYFPQASSTPASALRTGHRSRPHLQQQRTSGSYQPDHDAALRASLTTLLSCAAAVRPKDEQKTPERMPLTRPTQPTTLRLVPESELSQPRPQKQMKRRSRDSSKERHAKKLRSAKPVPTEETISPTLAYWMISAGVVLVFSALSFSAGYAWGKEVGRFEGEMGLSGGSCGREAMRGSGLRRIRWSTTGSGIAA